MISTEVKPIIKKITDRYGVSKVYIFGSSLHSDEYRDIDIAVEGIGPDDFFSLYGDLMFALPKPIDLIEIKKDEPFSSMVMEEAVLI